MPDDYVREEPEEAPSDRPKIKSDDLRSGEYAYPAQLTEVKKVLTRNPGTQSDFRPCELYQVFERADQKWPDGNHVRRINRFLIEWWDGTPMWQGCEADLVGQAFKEACGCSMFPDDEDTKLFIDHWFMIKDVVTPRSKDKDRPYYMRVPTEYLGPDYTYDGEVRTLQTKGDGDASGPEPGSGEPTPGAEDADAKTIAGVLAGAKTEDIRQGKGIALIAANEQARAIQQLWGKSVKGGLVKGVTVILDELLAKGYLGEYDGVLVPSA